MRFKRFVVGALGAALLGLTPTALASTPAQAAPSHPTIVQIDATRGLYLYGLTLVIKGRVLADGLGECADPSSTYCRPPDTAGVVDLYRRKAGSTTWAKIASRSSENADFSFGTTAVYNASYKVVFTGGTWGEHGFQASEGTRVVRVGRHPHGKVVKTSGGLFFVGNVDPGWGNSPVTIQRKACGGCGWRTYTRVRTSASGAYRTRVPAPRTGRWYWRSQVPGTSPTYTTSYSGVWYTFQS